MSWDGYRDNLVASGCIEKAAICDVHSGAVWTQSPDFNVSQLVGIGPTISL